MKLLIFDTECSGLIPKTSGNDLKNLPHIVQLSWIMYNTKTKSYVENDFILKIPILVPEDSTKIHGITNDISDNGYDFSEIVDMFLNDIKKCDMLVAHNIQYDLNMLEIELSRINRWGDIDLLFSKDIFDTMKQSVNVLKLPGKYGKYKFPRLSEVYIHFFGEMFENAHNAMGDIRATLKVYEKLNK